MKKFIRENKLWTIVLILFIAIPLFIQMHWLPFYQIGAFLTPGDHGDWLQFWGSYFGFIPTGLITFMVLKFQFKRQEIIDKNNFDEQLKKQKQEFIFEKEFEDLIFARNQVIKIWLESAEIIFVCESIEQSDEGVNFIYNQVAEHHEIIKNNQNALGGWIEEQINSERTDSDFTKMDTIAGQSAKILSEMRTNMERKKVKDVLSSAKLLKEKYGKLKEILTMKIIATKSELLK